MASESTEEETVTVELTDDLDEWLDDRATRLGVPRDELVRQLLASYRATDELDGELSALLGGDGDVAAAVDERVSERAETVIGDRLPDIVDAVEGRLDADIGEVEAEFQGKIEDVRERVIQLKREIDAKAPENHDHEEFDRLEDLERELSALVDDLASFRDEVDHELDQQAATTDDLGERLSDVEDKLRRVAWVVTDLRDEQGGQSSRQQAVGRIKRAAAQEGVATADCESCGEQVRIALLTDPQCPHCEATVRDVRPDGGFLRTKARLVTASQLESGQTDE